MIITINLRPILPHFKAREEEEQRRSNQCGDTPGSQFPNAPIHINDGGGSGGFLYSPTSESTQKPEHPKQHQNHVRPAGHHHRHGSSSSGSTKGSSQPIDPAAARSNSSQHRHGKNCFNLCDTFSKRNNFIRSVF